MTTASLSPTERRAALSLAGIFALRMLGLFMIYPVFAVYARTLPDATPTRIGLALGIYGLAQALCQIPLGILSDRVGRKRVIAGGLLVFAAGSVLAALSSTVQGIIFGRFLQGAGAVGSAVLALAADLTRDENRTKAMAIIGMTIGLSFGVAVVLGPALHHWLDVPGLFWLTAVLAGSGIAILYMVVPRPAETRVHADAEAVPAVLARVLKDGRLLRLDFAILAQHAILTATFLGLPLRLQASGIAAAQQWHLYLPVLLVAALTMVPLIILAERGGRMRHVMLMTVAAIALAQAGFLLGQGLWLIAVALAVFFSAFNFQEAALPSMISRLAPREAKGTAMGIYSSSQFLGIFIGGALGGWCQTYFGLNGVFGFAFIASLVWLAVLSGRGLDVPVPGNGAEYPAKQN